MPQPVKHTVDAMLDVTRALVLDAGPAAASARAVSLATGAPSGSIYHRFPRRDDLVAAAWLRAQDRFLAAYLPELAGSGPDAGAAAAVTVLTWSAAHRPDAALLLRHALDDLCRERTGATRERAEGNDRRLRAAIAAFAERSGRPPAQVVLAVVDLPYAVARRVLREDRDATAEEVEALRRAAAVLLAAPP